LVKKTIKENMIIMQSGRQQNRTVEVAIFANEKMKRMAKSGEL